MLHTLILAAIVIVFATTSQLALHYIERNDVKKRPLDDWKFLGALCYVTSGLLAVSMLLYPSNSYHPRMTLGCSILYVACIWAFLMIYVWAVVVGYGKLKRAVAKRQHPGPFTVNMDLPKLAPTNVFGYGSDARPTRRSPPPRFGRID